MHVLRYLDDESMRRGTLVQLNRGEGRHGLSRIVFHGKRGELRQRYREGQEDQLGALGRPVRANAVGSAMTSPLMPSGADTLSVRPDLGS